MSIFSSRFSFATWLLSSWLALTPATGQQYQTLPPDSVVGNLRGQSSPSFAVSFDELVVQLGSRGLVKGPSTATAGHVVLFGASPNVIVDGGGTTGGTVTQLNCNAGLTGGTISSSGTCALDGNYSGWAAQNCTITASVSLNVLTVSLKDSAGQDPSATSPCNINYRSATAAAGSTTLVPQTSALSINTNATGATLGSSNGVAFRFWVVAFNNSGSNVLALINCSNASTIFPLNEGAVASSSPMSGSATAAGVFYTPNGTTVTGKAYRILGHLEYSSGLATAGTYSSGPTAMQVFGPGIKRPGDVVQTLYNSVTGVSTTTNTYTHSNTAPVAANGGLVGSQAITPTAAPNHVRVRAQLVESSSASAPYGFAYIVNGGGTNLATAAGVYLGTNGYLTIPLFYEAVIGSSAVTYSLYGSSGAAGTTTFNGIGGNQEFGGTSSSYIQVEEIMG
jgi:hypothetical protein